MIAGQRCPKCNRPLPDPPTLDGSVNTCPGCRGKFEETVFPARSFVPPIETAAALSAGEASCFFHPQNRADVACEGCGRFLCPVCRVTVSGKSYCPSCLSASSTRSKLPENFRVIYSTIALGLAVMPLVLWPFTLITAPATLFLCFYGWKKPGGILQRGRRTRFVLAGMIASAQIAGWVFLGYYLVHAPKTHLSRPAVHAR